MEMTIQSLQVEILSVWKVFRPISLLYILVMEKISSIWSPLNICHGENLINLFPFKYIYVREKILLLSSPLTIYHRKEKKLIN